MNREPLIHPVDAPKVVDSFPTYQILCDPRLFVERTASVRRGADDAFRALLDVEPLTRAISRNLRQAVNDAELKSFENERNTRGFTAVFEYSTLSGGSDHATTVRRKELRVELVNVDEKAYTCEWLFVERDVDYANSGPCCGKLIGLLRSFKVYPISEFSSTIHVVKKQVEVSAQPSDRLFTALCCCLFLPNIVMACAVGVVYLTVCCGACRSVNVRVQKFVEYVENHSEQPETTIVDAVPVGMESSETLVESLERLGKLHEKGVLSDAEFSEAKAKVLVDV